MSDAPITRVTSNQSDEFDVLQAGQGTYRIGCAYHKSDVSLVEIIVDLLHLHHDVVRHA